MPLVVIGNFGHPHVHKVQASRLHCRNVVISVNPVIVSIHWGESRENPQATYTHGMTLLAAYVTVRVS
jgi:hypothetical protein